MPQILDYSAGYPGAGAIKARGYVGAIRYLRKRGASRVKPLTSAEVADFRAHGLALALVYQDLDARSRMLQGYDAGRVDAQWAVEQANACGVGGQRAVYFAADWDAQPHQYGPIAEYMRGTASVLGLERVGAYGKHDLIKYLFDHRRITWGWQCYAWSPGHNQDNQPREPRAHLFQRKGQTTISRIGCDINDILKPDYGQSPVEDDMTPDEMINVLYGLRVENRNLFDWSRQIHADLGLLQDGLTSSVQRLTDLVANENKVSAEQIAEALAPKVSAEVSTKVITALPQHLEKLTPEDLDAITKAVEDERSRRTKAEEAQKNGSAKD